MPPASRAEPKVAVGAVVFNGDGRVLLVRRGRPPGVGTWSLPGGRLEVGESMQDAVVREVREETALETRVVCSLGIVEVEIEGHRFAIHEHLMALVGPSSAARAGDDASAVQWVLMGDLAGVPVTEAVQRVVRLGASEARARAGSGPQNNVAPADDASTSVAAMKTSHVCPKCGHGEILFMPRVADRDDRDVVRPLSLHVLHYDWKDVEMGTLQAYVCRSCGYTELYTLNPAALPVDQIPGAAVLKAGSKT